MLKIAGCVYAAAARADCMAIGARMLSGSDALGELGLIWLVTCVAIVGTVLAFCYPGSDYVNSPLYQSFNENRLGSLRTAETAVFAATAPLVIKTCFEVFKGGMRNEEERRVIEARLVILAFILIPRIIIYNLTYPSSPSGSVTDQQLNQLCRCIVFLFEFQSFAVFASVALVVARKGEMIVRPSLVLPVLLGTGTHACMGLVLQGSARPDQQVQLVQWYRIFSLFYDLVGLLGVLVLLNEAWAVLVKGERLAGQRYDRVYLTLTSFCWYLFSWFGSNQTNAVLGFDRDYDVNFFIVYSSLSILVYLLLLFFHSMELTSRREHEQQRLMQDLERRDDALQLTACRLLFKEREMSIRLLHSIVPPRIADDLSHGREVPPQMFDFAVVLFSDIKGFNQFSLSRSPAEVFALLDRLFVVMDEAVSFFPKLYKVESCKESYLVVGGIIDEEENEEDESEAVRSSSNQDLLLRNFGVVNSMCQFALLVHKACREVRMDHSTFVQIRIGINCGPIITGLSGHLTPSFHVFGDTVNVASRMEKTGVADRIHVSSEFYSLVQHSPFAALYQFEKREPLQIKGKGQMKTYFLSCNECELRETFREQLEVLSRLVEAFDPSRADRAEQSVTKPLATTQSILTTSTSFSTAQASERSAPWPHSQSLHDLIRPGPGPGSGQEQERERQKRESSPAPASSAPSPARAGPVVSPAKPHSFKRFSLWEHLGLKGLVPEEAGIDAKITIGLLGSEDEEAGETTWLRVGAGAGAGAGEGAEGEKREPMTDYMGLPLPIALRRRGNKNTVGFPWVSSSESFANLASASAFVSYAEIMADNFSVLQVGSDKTSITAAIVAIFKGVFGDVLEAAVQVDTNTLWRFVRRIGTLYQNQPYHNFHHSFCVTRETARLLLHLGFIGGAKEKDTDAATLPSFSPRELFTILLCAVMHDVDHPGVNNDFLVRSNSQLALVYNDNSVLENHHIALHHSVTQDKSCDVLAKWNEADRREARRTITNAVLATDMAVHKTLQLNLEARAASLGPSPASASAAFDLSKDDDKQELVKVILHTADIFNPCRAFSVSAVLSNCMAEECRAQLARERSLGLSETPWMVLASDQAVAKGEAGFARHVARPYFLALAACFPENSRLNFVSAIDANVEAWEQLSFDR